MFIVALNLADADFYIQRNGSLETVGTPHKEGKADWFGVRVDRKYLLPDFFFYFAQYCHQGKVFEPYAHGSLRLKHLRVQDVRRALQAEAERVWGQPAQVLQLEYRGSWLAHTRQPAVAAALHAESLEWWAGVQRQRRRRLVAKRHGRRLIILTEKATKISVTR